MTTTPQDDSSANPRSLPAESSAPALVSIRAAVLRGLAIVMPSLLTIVLFIWAWNLIDSYVLRPIESAARQVIVWSIQDDVKNADLTPEMKGKIVENNQPRFAGDATFLLTIDGVQHVLINTNWIPKYVFDTVEANPGAQRPFTSDDYWHRYVQLRYLKRHFVIPMFLIVFIVVLYLLGKIVAAGIGRMFVNLFESFVSGLPVVRNVYSSVKQVTDFALKESDIKFTRIVAVEYPRKGVWSMGFVTGEGMLDVRTAANEPIVTVLIPTSPMPATGFTISVPKSETIDLSITMDQAIQFCVSCGVVVPPQQQTQRTIVGEIKSRMPETASLSSTDGQPAEIPSDQEPDSSAADSSPADDTSSPAGD